MPRPVAAGPDRRVAARGYERLGFGPRSDHRADHAAEPEVEGAHQVGRVVPRDADEGNSGEALERSLEKSGEVCKRRVTVLEVDHDGVEANRGDGGCGGRALEREPRGEGGLAGCPASANGVGTTGPHRRRERGCGSGSIGGLPFRGSSIGRAADC